jgi:hypothetical protein
MLPPPTSPPGGVVEVDSPGSDDEVVSTRVVDVTEVVVSTKDVVVSASAVLVVSSILVEVTSA